MAQSTRSQLFVGIVSGVVGTVFGGLLLLWIGAWFTGDSDTTPQKPALTVVAQQVKVPAQPISYEVREKANPTPKNPDLERLFEQASFGFRVVQYDIRNETKDLLRDVELKAPTSDRLFQDGVSEVIPVDMDKLTFDIPPGQYLRIVSLQKYPDTDLTASIGNNYYQAVDLEDFTKDRATEAALKSVDDRSYRIDRSLVQIFGLPLSFILLSLAWSTRPWRSNPAASLVKEPIEGVTIDEINVNATQPLKTKLKRSTKNV